MPPVLLLSDDVAPTCRLVSPNPVRPDAPYPPCARIACEQQTAEVVARRCALLNSGRTGAVELVRSNWSSNWARSRSIVESVNRIGRGDGGLAWAKHGGRRLLPMLRAYETASCPPQHKPRH